MAADKKIISYEPMIHSIIQQLNILYDKDEYMQVGRIAVFEAVNKFDSSKNIRQRITICLYTHQAASDR
jgi:DNA-directed RNA polymerase specialized sigma subunit